MAHDHLLGRLALAGAGRLRHRRRMNGTQITNSTATGIGNVPPTWLVQAPNGERTRWPARRSMRRAGAGIKSELATF
jgi:hypothetical protein